MTLQLNKCNIFKQGIITGGRKMLIFILKVSGIIGATIVAYALATTKTAEGTLTDTHPFWAVLVEVAALAIIFMT